MRRVEACAQLRIARQRILEKLGAESAKSRVMTPKNPARRICLHVSFQKREVAKARRRTRIGRPYSRQDIATIPRAPTGWPTKTRTAHRSIPKAAAGIYRPVVYSPATTEDFFAMKCHCPQTRCAANARIGTQDNVPEFYILASLLRREWASSMTGTQLVLSEDIGIFAVLIAGERLVDDLRTTGSPAARPLGNVLNGELEAKPTQGCDA